MNRRQFLAGSAAAGTLALARPGQLIAEPAKPSQALRLVLIHTNDVHSRLDPMDTGDYKGLGGVEARAAAIRKLRAEHDQTLVLDAGDMLQGTPYFNLFGGEAEFRAMSAIGYDAATAGNHDFDNGTQSLADNITRHGNFPVLNCNYDVKDTPLAGRLRESVTFEKAGLRIGVIGVGISLEGLVMKELHEGVIYKNPITEVERVAKVLRNDEKCDFIICLSHLNLNATGQNRSGEPGDRDIAARIPEVDVVIGGHNHFFLEQPDRVWRAKSPAFIGQAGWGGTHLGLMALDIFERDKKTLATARLHEASLALT